MKLYRHLSPTSVEFYAHSLTIVYLLSLIVLLSSSWVDGQVGSRSGGKHSVWWNKNRATLRVKSNLYDDDDDGGGGGIISHNTHPTNETKTTGKMIDMDQIMNDMGIGNSPDSDSAEAGLSAVKIIPDEHHVSAFLNRGISKRFLFVNAKEGNPLSITITPCTSILLWSVKFWPITENGTQSSEHLKAYRTQRTVTFTEKKARRGVYCVEIRALYLDSYVHVYATSTNSEPILSTSSSFYENDHNYRHHQHFHSPASESQAKRKLGKDYFGNDLAMNDDTDTHSGSESHPAPMALLYNKPRISVRRLRGNRLHVKWDASPVNPHLMQYCIVVNTRRDYTSLCAASGERYGVLPPDLMHVSYYTNGGKDSDPIYSMESSESSEENSSSDSYTSRESKLERLLQTQHQQRNDLRNFIKTRDEKNRRNIFDDIIIGCVNKKTNYILNNLQEGRLYYFNVFLKDLSTNLSYPYVRTTLKYHIPRNTPNNLRDAKPLKVKLLNGKPTTLKFNLNKPCSELTMYIMPCGGGAITFQVFHGNRSIFDSAPVDSLDIIKVAIPRRGKYYIKIFPSSGSGPTLSNGEDTNYIPSTNVSASQARMAEVFISKKNKRFPLPKLPANTKVFDEEASRTCDSVIIKWWPSPDARDNDYCIFLKEETRKLVFLFKQPNQCDVERSLKSDPYVTLSMCLERTPASDRYPLSQKITGLQPSKTYVVQLIVRRYNGKALSYDLHHVRTSDTCLETYPSG